MVSVSLCSTISVNQSLSPSDHLTFLIGLYRLCKYLQPGFDLSRMIIKVPSTWEGLQACRKLKGLGVKTLGTTLFTLEQGILAAEAGCIYVSPFLNELRAGIDPTCVGIIPSIDQLISISFRIAPPGRNEGLHRFEPLIPLTDQITDTTTPIPYSTSTSTFKNITSSITAPLGSKPAPRSTSNRSSSLPAFQPTPHQPINCKNSQPPKNPLPKPWLVRSSSEEQRQISTMLSLRMEVLPKMETESARTV